MEAFSRYALAQRIAESYASTPRGFRLLCMHVDSQWLEWMNERADVAAAEGSNVRDGLCLALEVACRWQPPSLFDFGDRGWMAYCRQKRSWEYLRAIYHL